jgi:DNA repair exonuclease SbcCD nuclease subunit
MVRLLQTSDVHLGARHLLLGDRAADQRERQFGAFEQAVDVALTNKVDLFLVAGDLFDAPVAGTATVERVGAALARLASARIRTVILPGDHDAPGRASIYHAHDLVAMVGGPADDTWLTVLTDEAPDRRIAPLGTFVTSRFPVPDAPEDGHRIGLIHRTSRPRDDEIAAAGVDHLAIGGPHRAESGRAGNVSWAASGAPELVDEETTAAGEVLLVTLDDGGGRPVVERVRVGRTRYERQAIDLTGLTDPARVDAAITARTDPDLILDVRLSGSWSDALDIDPARLAIGHADEFFRLLVRDEAVVELTPEPLPPADSIAGAFVRDLEARIAAAESEIAGRDADPAPASELRHALRLGRRLLAGQGSER